MHYCVRALLRVRALLWVRYCLCTIVYVHNCMFALLFVCAVVGVLLCECINVRVQYTA